MARAKRTNQRADARRRYRTAQLAEEGEPEGENTGATKRVAASARGGEKAPAERPSFTAAFRNAYHRANVREDLPYLPSLLRHWSFWVPLLLMVGSGVAVVALPGQPLVLFLGQTFVYPPALIVLFICGFFTKRASYLLGAILGVVNVIVYAAVLAYSLQGVEKQPTSAELQAVLLNALVFAPPSGILFCSLAAWYRRFLALTNPNRGRRPQQKARPKPSR